MPNPNPLMGAGLVSETNSYTPTEDAKSAKMRGFSLFNEANSIDRF